MSLATRSGVSGLRSGSRLTLPAQQAALQWSCRVVNASGLVSGRAVGGVQKREISIQALDERKGGMFLQSFCVYYRNISVPLE